MYNSLLNLNYPSTTALPIQTFLNSKHTLCVSFTFSVRANASCRSIIFFQSSQTSQRQERGYTFCISKCASEQYKQLAFIIHSQQTCKSLVTELCEKNWRTHPLKSVPRYNAFIFFYCVCVGTCRRIQVLLRIWVLFCTFGKHLCHVYHWANKGFQWTCHARCQCLVPVQEVVCSLCSKWCVGWCLTFM